jgi:hypothetical protein
MRIVLDGHSRLHMIHVPANTYRMALPVSHAEMAVATELMICRPFSPGNCYR